MCFQLPGFECRRMFQGNHIFVEVIMTLDHRALGSYIDSSVVTGDWQPSRGAVGEAGEGRVVPVEGRARGVAARAPVVDRVLCVAGLRVHCHRPRDHVICHT
ncbi:unnamed protein product [Chrysodeixis includens]|uniref:Uncharacterized protein n=1 Tax=Chrysodeixis includens TaxID=689277 RepID=A0A9N8PZD8_CHRIL|nr:unnamed protein product [Chrysodeixis includens]